jgi:hypothetical protein
MLLERNVIHFRIATKYQQNQQKIERSVWFARKTTFTSFGNSPLVRPYAIF